MDMGTANDMTETSWDAPVTKPAPLDAYVYTGCVWYTPYVLAAAFLFLVGFGGSPAHAQSGTSCDGLLQRSDSLSTRYFTEAWYNNDADLLRRTKERQDVLRQARQRCTASDAATAYAQSAYVEAQLRNFDAVTALFERFFADYGEVPADTSSVSRSKFRVMHTYYAFLHYQMGDLAEAAQGYSRGLRVVSETNTTQRIYLLKNLALMYQRMRDRETALQTYRRALREVEQLDPSSADYRERRADLLFSRAGMYAELGMSDNASRWPLVKADLTESLDLYPAPGTVLQANRLSALAEAHANTGDLDTALTLNAEALSEAEAAGSSRTRAFLQYVQGKILMMDAQWDAAQTFLQRALDQQPERRYEDRRRILQQLGLLHERQGHLVTAASQYEQAIAAVEAHRMGLRATEWAADAFGDWQEAYRGLVRVRLMQGRPRSALQTLERTRARYLADLRLEADLVHAMTPEQRVRYDSLTQELQTVRSDRARSDRPARVAELRRHETRLMTARQQLLSLPPADPVSIEAMQDTLATQQRVAVSYMLDNGNRSIGRPAQSVAFVVTPDTVRAVPLGIRESDLHDMLGAASPLFSGSQDAGSIGGIQIDLRVMHDVYQAIFAPLAPHLPDGARLVTVPDGLLFRLPFALLVSADPPGRYDYPNARFLIEEHPLSMRLSLSSLAAVPASRARTLDIAALGRSEFDTASSEVLVADAAPTVRRRNASGSASGALPALPGVERELRRVTDLFRDGRLRLNQEATASALNDLIGGASILHLSSHALVNPDAPLQNAFVLAPSTEEGMDGSDDGLLYLHELQGQFASIPLVNLSGCETAYGALQNGEGMRSLQYAFRAVGAEATLSTVWPIDDNAAVTLNEAFYRHLRSGASKDVALQQAQLRYRSLHPERSPFFWAGLVLHGTPAPIRVASPVPWIRYAGLLALLVLSGAGVYVWQRRRGAPRTA